MDIDTMSPKHQKLFKEGKCFNCQKQDHQSWDCNQPWKRCFSQNYNNHSRPAAKPQFKTAKKAHAHIWALLADLLKEEAAKVIELAEEEEGF